MKISFFEIQGWETKTIKSKLGNNVKIFHEPLTEKNVSQVKDSEILSVFIYSKISAEILKKLPKLKAIVTRSTGFDHIDVKACVSRKIKVFNIPSYGENTVAEHTFALILALSRNVHKAYLRTIKNDFSVEGLKGFDLKDKTLGVIGAGKIGKHVIRIARGFEMRVLVSDRHQDEFLAEQLNFKYVSFDELIKKSDIVTIHVPYSKENHHLFDKKLISKMKRGAILINTSRGAIIDTKALLYGLDKKILSGVGLDVLEGEELIKEEKQLLYEKEKSSALKIYVEDHALLERDNVVFTPHIAFYSQEALERIIDQTIKHIETLQKGQIDKSYLVC